MSSSPTPTPTFNSSIYPIPETELHRPTQYSGSNSNHRLATMAMKDGYATLNFIGVLLLLLLILTIAFSYTNIQILPTSSKKAKGKTSNRHPIRRDPCLINSFIIVIFVNILNNIYYLHIRQRLTPKDLIPPSLRNPPEIPGSPGFWPPNPAFDTVCRVQAVLQPGSQAAQAAAVFAVVFRLWLKTNRLPLPWLDNLRRWPFLTFLLALPYLCFIGFIPPLVILIQPSRNPNLIIVPFYCSLLNHNVKLAGRTACLVISALALGFETWTMVLIWRYYRQTDRATRKAREAMCAIHGVDGGLRLGPNRSIAYAFFIRIILFVIWTVAMMTTTLYQSFDYYAADPISDLAYACIAPLAFFCFATQPDILRAWHIPATKVEWRQLLKPILTSTTTTTSSSTFSAATRTDWRQPRDRDSSNGHDQDDDKLHLGEFLGGYETDLNSFESESEGGDVNRMGNNGRTRGTSTSPSPSPDPSSMFGSPLRHQHPEDGHVMHGGREQVDIDKEFFEFVRDVS